MKLKRQAEDFQVEELPTVVPGDRGRFVYYRLTKRGLGTPEAIEAVRRRWNIPAARIDYGGLKDRHAETIQYLTILEGPEREIRERNYILEPIGRLPFAYGPTHFRGNRFDLTLRDMGREAADRAVRSLASLGTDGVPNYFDDQRFGSVGFDGGFIAEAWLKGDPERALRLAIAEPTASDRPETRDEKAILRECWGRWSEAKARLGRSHARSLVTYLVDHPEDFRGAFVRVRRDLRSIWFSAYQSHLWNKILGRLIESITRPDQRIAVDFKLGPLPVHHDLDAEQAAMLRGVAIPLPSSRSALPEGPPLRPIVDAVLEEAGLAWNDLRVKWLKDVFFSKGDRKAVFFPSGLKHSVEADELYPGRKKVRLGFELPKGAYATLVVKRLTEQAVEPRPTP